MQELLAARGAAVDAIYYCPHHPSPAAPADNGKEPAGRVAAQPVVELCYECDCRKPKPGLARRAAAELGVDLASSWMVGDKKADLGLAENAGLKGGILVKTGYGEETLAQLKAAGRPPAYVAADLVEAAAIILGRS
jgi:histidinol-phosphate phosphatase family protein